MSELEWEKRFHTMMGQLSCTASERKRRLFACACARRIWHLLSDEQSASAVVVAERFADGLSNNTELDVARQQARIAEGRYRTRGQRSPWTWWAARTAVTTTYKRAGDTVQSAYNAMVAAVLYTFPAEEDDLERDQMSQDEETVQAAVLRDILGNPRYRLAVDPSWLRWDDGTVPRIAQGIYEERAFDRLPILHDALLDAGCDCDDILAHCRGAGPHVRGCWVIDLLLGKA
jgi:hypothetical protein